MKMIGFFKESYNFFYRLEYFLIHFLLKKSNMENIETKKVKNSYIYPL